MTRIVFGTTSIGLPYGLPDAAGGAPVPLSEAAARSLVDASLAAGVHVFDTAPGYGVAEERLGRVLPEDAEVWTKVDRRGAAAGELEAFTRASVAESRRRLARSRIECVQWHNFEAAWLEEEGFADAMRALRDDGNVCSVGATTYGAENALAAVRSGLFSRVQVEWSLVNQSVVRAVEAEALARGVSLAVRSVLLQGALTTEGRTLPDKPRLREAVHEARRAGAAFAGGLTELAYRAAFSLRSVSSVLIGFRSAEEIAAARVFEDLPPIDVSAFRALDLDGHEEADPRTW